LTKPYVSRAMVAAMAAVICGKSQYAPNPPNAGKLMLLARHEVASQIVHSAVCSGAARHSKGADSPALSARDREH
jgi:hypothetical protein